MKTQKETMRMATDEEKKLIENAYNMGKAQAISEFKEKLKEKQYVWVTDNAKTGEGHYQISPIGIFIKVEDVDKTAQEMKA